MSADADGCANWQAIVPRERCQGAPDFTDRGTHAAGLAVRSPSIGRVEKQSPPWRKGNHRDGGFVFASGPLSKELIPSVQVISEIGTVVQRLLTSQVNPSDTGCLSQPPLEMAVVCRRLADRAE